MSEINRPGSFEAIQELFCGHMINTGRQMNEFAVAKGQLTECLEGCGLQKTKHIRSGKAMPSNVAVVR